MTDDTAHVQDESDDPQPAAMIRVPTAFTIYGRPTDYIEVESQEAAKQWDARLWRELP